MRIPSICHIALALVLCTAGLSAQASQSGPFVTSSPIPYTLTDWSGALTLPKFDSSLGLLTEVDILISAGIRTTLTATNTASSASTGMAQTEVAVTFTDPLSLLSLGPDIYSPAFTFSLAPGASVTSGLLTKNGSDSQSFTDAAILAEFTGPGSVILNASTFTQTWISYNGGNTRAAQVTAASGTGRVTYYYTPTYRNDDPVPEPCSLFLAANGAGIGLVLGLRRRLRSRR